MVQVRVRRMKSVTSKINWLTAAKLLPLKCLENSQLLHRVCIASARVLQDWPPRCEMSKMGTFKLPKRSKLTVKCRSTK